MPPVIPSATPGWTPLDATGSCSEVYLPDTLGNVHVFGTYQGSPTIYWEVDEPVILVLTSYQVERWTIEEQFPGSIQEIIVSTSTDPAIVDAPPGVVVTSVVLPFTYGYYDGATRSLEASLAQRGLTMSAFHGCYEMENVRVSTTPQGNPVLRSPDCSDATPFGPPSTAILPLACQTVVNDATVCLGGDGVLIGATSGATCPLTPLNSEGFAVAWSGRHAYVCSQGSVNRVDLITLDTHRTIARCSESGSGGVTLHDGSLVVEYQFGEMDRYDSWGALNCAQPDDVETRPRGTRYGVYDGHYYHLWHSTDVIERDPVNGGSPLVDIPLTFDGWTAGISATSDHIVVQRGRNTSEGEIYTYDRQGALQHIHPSRYIGNGMHCATP